MEPYPTATGHRQWPANPEKTEVAHRTFKHNDKAHYIEKFSKLLARYANLQHSYGIFSQLCCLAMQSNVVTGRFGGPSVSRLISVLGGWCDDEADIAHRGRRLREAGILPTGRRGGGRGAAEITSQHCIALLLGFMGTTNASRAVDIYRVTRTLPYERITMNSGNGEVTVETAKDGGGTDLSTLAADLAKIVEIYRAGRRLSHRNLHLTGIHLTRDTENPVARLELGSPEHEDAGLEMIRYARPGQVPKKTVASFWVDGAVVQLFADLLGPPGRSTSDGAGALAGAAP